ncbi:MAG TPA: TonB-dependent receptor, partial [Opitutales bacterium]|nr:TonB-dependent receptor [Opitutales bacterium]
EVRFDVEDEFLSDGDDSGERNFRETSPMVGLLWAPLPELSFYVNWTTSFETPTTTELDNPDGGGFNPALESQSSESIELGLRARLPDAPWRPEVELVAFSIEVEDALVPFELPASPGRDFFRNAGSTRKEGLEAVLTVRPAERLSATLSYTYSDFKYEDFDSPDGDFGGNRLPGVPEHFGNLRIGYRHPGGVSLVWNTRVVCALQADDANATEVSGYSFSDLRLAWEHRLGDWTLEAFGGVNNLFDQEYSANIRINAFGGRYFEPAPERNVFAGIRLRYWFGKR